MTRFRYPVVSPRLETVSAIFLIAENLSSVWAIGTFYAELMQAVVRRSLQLLRCSQRAAGFFLAWCLLPAVGTLDAAHAQGTTVSITPLSAAGGEQPPAPWRVVGIPGGKIPLTSFSMVKQDGIKVVRIEARQSYGNLVHALAGAPVPAPGQQLRWRWRLDRPLPAADLGRKAGDDSPVKVCALFDQPLDRLSLVDRTLLRLARAASAESLPSATLCYVWDARLPAGTVLSNAYTGRVKLMVLDSGEQRLGEWSVHSRDLALDFRLAFGGEGDTVPPWTAVLVGADADNTGGSSLAFVGDIGFGP